MPSPPTIGGAYVVESDIFICASVYQLPCLCNMWSKNISNGSVRYIHKSCQQVKMQVKLPFSIAQDLSERSKKKKSLHVESCFNSKSFRKKIFDLRKLKLDSPSRPPTAMKSILVYIICLNGCP